MKLPGIFKGISIICTTFIENLISIGHTLLLITTPYSSPSPAATFKLLPIALHAQVHYTNVSHICFFPELL